MNSLDLVVSKEGPLINVDKIKTLVTIVTILHVISGYKPASWNRRRIKVTLLAYRLTMDSLVCKKIIG